MNFPRTGYIKQAHLIAFEATDLPMACGLKNGEQVTIYTQIGEYFVLQDSQFIPIACVSWQPPTCTGAPSPPSLQEIIFKGHISAVQQYLNALPVYETFNTTEYVKLCEELLLGADPTICMDPVRHHNIQNIRELLKNYKKPSPAPFTGIIEPFVLNIPDAYWEQYTPNFVKKYKSAVCTLVDTKYAAGTLGEPPALEEVQQIVASYFIQLLEAAVVNRTDAEQTIRLAQKELLETIQVKFPAVSHFPLKQLKKLNVPPIEYWEGDLEEFLEPFYCPLGWTLLRAHVEHYTSPKFCGKEKIATFHGTSPEVVKLIVANGFLPAKIACGATKPTCYFTPSLLYAAHPRYAKPVKVGTDCYAQAVLLVAVDPKLVYKRIGETLRANGKGILIDARFPENNGVEQLASVPDGKYLKPSDGAELIGVLIRVSSNLQDLAEVAHWWGCPGAKFAVPPFQ